MLLQECVYMGVNWNPPYQCRCKNGYRHEATTCGYSGSPCKPTTFPLIDFVTDKTDEGAESSERISR